MIYLDIHFKRNDLVLYMQMCILYLMMNFKYLNSSFKYQSLILIGNVNLSEISHYRLFTVRHGSVIIFKVIQGWKEKKQKKTCSFKSIIFCCPSVIQLTVVVGKVLVLMYIYIYILFCPALSWKNFTATFPSKLSMYLTVS